MPMLSLIGYLSTWLLKMGNRFHRDRRVFSRVTCDWPGDLFGPATSIQVSD
jgi:hypothetical protein